MIEREQLLAETTILTASGRIFDYADPDPSQILLSDVLLALAKTCRYGGHVPDGTFVSVAEHLVVALHCLDQLHLPYQAPQELRWAVLCHDFAEAFTGDIPGPMKRQLGAPWKEFERRIEAVVFACFSVRPDLVASPPRHQADRLAYEVERRHIFGWTDVQIPPHVIVPPTMLGLRWQDAYRALAAKIYRLAPEVGREDLSREARLAWETAPLG